LYICDVTGKDGFEAEIYATKGIGFKSFLENKENIETLSIIPIDSNFSPIVHANFKVEELKLAKHKVGDELTIEVGTNGSITPNNALALAGKILLDHFTAIANIDSNVIGSSFIQEKTLESTAKTLSTSIDELNLSVRSYNCLKRTGIQTIQDLISYSKEDIKNIKNMGLKSYKEIFKVVEQKGYSFAG
jgi:DNA-directed RNA polymerase subunit alpha